MGSLADSDFRVRGLGLRRKAKISDLAGAELRARAMVERLIADDAPEDSPSGSVVRSEEEGPEHDPVVSAGRVGGMGQGVGATPAEALVERTGGPMPQRRAGVTAAVEAEAIANMTVLELKELLDAFEQKFDVTAAPPIAAERQAQPTEVETEDELDEFDVVLSGAGAQRIRVIKVVRELTSLGLKEAKDLVDSAPQPILLRVGRTSATDAQAKLSEAGAEVEIR